MNVSVESLNSFTKKLSFELPADMVDAEYDKVFKTIRSAARMPGFRKGKIPAHVIEQQYSATIKDEVLKNLVSATCFVGLQNHRIIPVSPPTVESDTVTKGEPFTYSVKVETYPDIEVKKYKGLILKKEQFVYNEASVQERLTLLQERGAQLKPLDAARPIASGDFVTIDYTGYLDGVPFPGGSATDHQLQIGSESFIPGFEEQIIGMNADETKRIAVTFPDTYAAELAGKDAEFEITVKDVKVKDIPDLDDDFAQTVGGFDTFAQLLDDVTASVKAEERFRIEGGLHERLQELLVDLNPCEIPEIMVQRHLDYQRTSMKQRLAAQRMTLEAIGLSDDNFNEHFRENATRQVKQTLLLHAIAKQEGISVIQEELDAKYALLAAQQDQNLAEVTAYFAKNREEAQGMRIQILQDKVISFLLDNATITEVSKDELEK